MIFEEIYQTYWQKVFRLCMGYFNDQAQAKDISQETFITVWQQLPKFRNESAVDTWIFRIASNHCLRQLKKQKKMQKIGIEHDPEAPESPTINAELDFLYQCIAELPEIDRLIISLELEELPQSEIAAVTGISEGNVRVKIHRIKEKLTKKFSFYERR